MDALDALLLAMSHAFIFASGWHLGQAAGFGKAVDVMEGR